MKVNCICCNNELEAEPVDNPATIPSVYDGLIFRSTGNFGSTVFDPITLEEILQVVICDNCVRVKYNRVTRIHSIERKTDGVSETFCPRG